MLVCMVMNSLPLAFEGDLSVSMDKSLARRNLENKSLGAPAVRQGHPSPAASSPPATLTNLPPPYPHTAPLFPDLNQHRFMI